MSQNRTIIKVFLASPGDLVDERRAARDAVEEVNSSTAKPHGYQIDLYGWEDTISAAGRPQAIINDELRQCELFIGMLWAKWGTPPDNDGRFTSGFEEEFALATEARQNGGLPEIRMYFKDVDDARVKDPGPELSKVLAFQNRLIDEKRILFERFGDSADFARRLRLGLASYVNRKHSECLTAALETETPPDVASSQADAPAPQDADGQPKVQAHFLESVAEKLRGPAPHESVTASQVARLRLAAMSQVRQGNDDPEMGPHDTNLLYRERGNFDFEPSEIHALARFGLGAVSAQNKPLWLWLSSALQNNSAWLFFETWSARASERKGAFAAAQLAGVDLLAEEFLPRDSVVRQWLSREDAEARKDALGYLKGCGNNNDLPIILEKMSTGSRYTSRELLEAALAILARYDIAAASELVVRTPFDDIDAALLDEVLQGFSRLQQPDLALALEHRSGKVRERALREMILRGTAPSDLGRRFADDSYLPVRQLALSIIESSEGRLSNDEVKKILIKPKSQGLGISFGLLRSDFDSEGNRAFEQEKLHRLETQPVTVLQAMIDNCDIDSQFAYFAMVKRDFQAMGQGLRRNFDDRFVAFFAAELERLRMVIGTSPKASELLDRWKATQAQMRKQYMTWALALLMSRSEPQDLCRIRSAIDDDSIEISRELFAYLGKHGDWSDIQRLAVIAPTPLEKREYSLLLGSTYLNDSAAAIHAIASKRVPELVALDLKADLLAKILKLATSRGFAALADDQICNLLLSDNDELRRVIALKVVATLGVRRAKAIFDTHLGGERYFYNVVYWLDLLVAFPHAKAKQMAKEALRMG